MLAIDRAEALAGCSLQEVITDCSTGDVRKIKLVTDNGSAFKEPQPTS
jgi:hypothetical protein